MGTGSFCGRIKGNIKGITKMIKRKAMESFIGLMADIIKVSGKMESNMEKDFIRDLQGWKEKAYGMMAKKSNGWMSELKNI